MIYCLPSFHTICSRCTMHWVTSVRIYGLGLCVFSPHSRNHRWHCEHWKPCLSWRRLRSRALARMLSPQSFRTCRCKLSQNHVFWSSLFCRYGEIVSCFSLFPWTLVKKSIDAEFTWAQHYSSDAKAGSAVCLPVYLDVRLCMCSVCLILHSCVTYMYVLCNVQVSLSPRLWKITSVAFVTLRAQCDAPNAHMACVCVYSAGTITSRRLYCMTQLLATLSMWCKPIPLWLSSTLDHKMRLSWRLLERFANARIGACSHARKVLHWGWLQLVPATWSGCHCVWDRCC